MERNLPGFVWTTLRVLEVDGESFLSEASTGQEECEQGSASENAVLSLLKPSGHHGPARTSTDHGPLTLHSTENGHKAFTVTAQVPQEAQGSARVSFLSASQFPDGWTLCGLIKIVSSFVGWDKSFTLRKIQLLPGVNGGACWAMFTPHFLCLLDRSLPVSSLG